LSGSLRSNHPLSRSPISASKKKNNIVTPDEFLEHTGKRYRKQSYTLNFKLVLFDLQKLNSISNPSVSLIKPRENFVHISVTISIKVVSAMPTAKWLSKHLKV
jgi:Cu+-exporting ATPase